MASGIYVSMGAARNQEHRMETLSNDLANANTAGYKSQESIYRQIHNDASALGSSKQAMGLNHPVRFLPEDRLPVAMVERYTKFSQGSFRHTGNELDLAINGRSFFTIQGQGGPVYTRNGTFTLNKDGLLTDQQGNPVLSDTGATIQAPGATGKIGVSTDGLVLVDGDTIGKLGIVEFPNTQILERMGNSNFKHPDPNFVAGPAENIDVRQGFLETANVNPVHTMAMLVKTNRLFELNTRALQAYKAMDDLSARDVGRI
jgi:flagellar basal-body rod protein FlgF